MDSKDGFKVRQGWYLVIKLHGVEKWSYVI